MIVATTTSHLASAGLLAVALLVVGRRAAARRELSRRLATLIQTLGPAFIKGAQVLATRRDVIPAAACRALSRLHDAVAPISEREASAALAATYGEDLDRLFARIDSRPIGSGSIACVYRAWLHDGREVAIKLRRPGVQETITADLAIVAAIGTLAARLPGLRGVPVAEVVGHLCDAVRGQLDLAREAAGLVELRANLSNVPRVWVPRVETALSRGGAIVMELVPGLERDIADGCPSALRKRFATTTLGAVYHMLFVDGFVHCDLHPGNLYFTHQGDVVVLDAGFSTRLSDAMRRLFAEFFLNMSLGRGEECARITIQSSSSIRHDADLAGFTHDVAALVRRCTGLSARQFSLIAFATELFAAQRRHGLRGAPELVFPLLALLVVEGAVRQLDPDIDFQSAARPVLTRGVFGALDRRSFRQDREGCRS